MLTNLSGIYLNKTCFAPESGKVKDFCPFPLNLKKACGIIFYSSKSQKNVSAYFGLIDRSLSDFDKE